jgi:hypothetical protein
MILLKECTYKCVGFVPKDVARVGEYRTGFTKRKWQAGDGLQELGSIKTA